MTNVRVRECDSHKTLFLAPTGAQGMLMSVCAAQSALEQSIFIFRLESTQKATKEQLSSQSITIRVIKSEPKILSLVSVVTSNLSILCVILEITIDKAVVS